MYDVCLAVLNPQIGSYSVFPPYGGVSQRIFNLLKDIDRNGIQAKIFSIGQLNQEHQFKGVKEKIIAGRRIRKQANFLFKILDHSIYPFTGTSWTGWILDFNSHIIRHIQNYNPNVIECSAGIPLMCKLSTKIVRKLGIPLVISAHNVAADVYSTFYDAFFGKFPVSFHSMFVAPILKREMLNYKQADHVICVSKEDAKTFSRFGIPQEKLAIIPNGVNWNLYRKYEFIGGSRNDFRRKLGYNKSDFIVCFLGAANYFPNDQAVSDIITRIAPECQRRNSKIHFMIVGRNRKPIRSRNINVVGEVKTPIPYLLASDMAICPIFSGGGTKLKLLEFLAAGLPTITSYLGLRGLDIDPNSIVIENDVRKYPLIIHDLKLEPAKRKSLSKSAISSSFKYSWPKLQMKYLNFIRKVTDDY